MDLDFDERNDEGMCVDLDRIATEEQHLDRRAVARDEESGGFDWLLLNDDSAAGRTAGTQSQPAGLYHSSFAASQISNSSFPSSSSFSSSSSESTVVQSSQRGDHLVDSFLACIPRCLPEDLTVESTKHEEIETVR